VHIAAQARGAKQGCVPSFGRLAQPAEVAVIGSDGVRDVSGSECDVPCIVA
jgi:hypothetical protein